VLPPQPAGRPGPARRRGTGGWRRTTPRATRHATRSSSSSVKRPRRPNHTHRHRGGKSGAVRATRSALRGTPPAARPLSLPPRLPRPRKGGPFLRVPAARPRDVRAARGAPRRHRRHGVAFTSPHLTVRPRQPWRAAVRNSDAASLLTPHQAPISWAISIAAWPRFVRSVQLAQRRMVGD
jgi:hypothetical protein